MPRPLQCAASFLMNLLKSPVAPHTLHLGPQNLPSSVFTLAGLLLVSTISPLFPPSDPLTCLPDTPPDVLMVVNLSLSSLPSPSLKPSILSRLSVPPLSPPPSQDGLRTSSLKVSAVSPCVFSPGWQVSGDQGLPGTHV